MKKIAWLFLVEIIVFAIAIFVGGCDKRPTGIGVLPEIDMSEPYAIFRLTDDELPDWSAHYSPDGKQLQVNRNGHMWVISAVSGKGKELTWEEHCACELWDQSGSRDGKWWAHIDRQFEDCVWTSFGRDSIRVVLIEDPSIYQAFSPREEIYDAIFASDGRIVFAAPKHGDVEICFLDIESGEEEIVARLYGITRIKGFSISPDGSQIVLGGLLQEDYYNDRDNYGLYLIDIKSGRVCGLTQTWWADNKNPCFSPDGEKIAFSSDRKDSYDIWIMNLTCPVISIDD